MPDWKPEIKRRLADLKLDPTREAEIVEELSQHLADHYVGSRWPAARRRMKLIDAALAELSDYELIATGTEGS